MRKNIMNAIRFLKNTWILLKGTTRKITSQEGGFLNFLRRLMITGLSLMKIHLHHQLKVSGALMINDNSFSNI